MSRKKCYGNYRKVGKISELRLGDSTEDLGWEDGHECERESECV